MMQRLLPTLLVVAAGIALWIAFHAPESDYRAPSLSDPVAAAGAPAVLKGAPGPHERLLEFSVEGMCCRGCTEKLYDSVVAVDGVIEAAVDFEARKARVIARQAVDGERVLGALNFDKYAAVALP
jgi:copper chaperone CopZ